MDFPQQERVEGEWADVVAALDGRTSAFSTFAKLDLADLADLDDRDRVRQLMVALLRELGKSNPVDSRYPRRLAAALY